VKYLGMYNYALYDTAETVKSSSQRVLADSDEVTEVLNYTKSNYATPDEAYFGKAEGMNVVYLHLESIQTFLMNYKLNGEEVTPFLNSLTKDQNTMYFDNFFHQTAQGKTADAIHAREFAVRFAERVGVHHERPEHVPGRSGYAERRGLYVRRIPWQ
jgi:lipoteichoic acid synthase